MLWPLHGLLWALHKVLLPVSDVLRPLQDMILNTELGWETIEKRADILGLNIFQKIHLQETRPLIRNCMPKLDFERRHFLRSNGGYIPFRSLGSYFKKIVFPLFLLSLELSPQKCTML